MDELLNARYRPESAGALALGAGEIHVWAVPLQGDAEAFMPLLSSYEQQKIGRFLVIDHRRRYAIAHGALRAILAGYLGADAVDLEFDFGPRGKPYLRGARMPFFNLTHSGQLALVAVAAVEVGVDVEKLRHLESLRDIARRHFSPSEFAALESQPAAEHLHAFYRCWTRKEAYIKALGAGLSLPLDVFDVAIGPEAAFAAIRHGDERPEQWFLADVSPAADFVGALACRGPKWSVRTLALQVA